jgi:hypothetical protein
MEDGDIPYCKITAKRNCVVHDTSRRQRRCKLVVQSQRKVLRRLSLSATLILLSASYAVAAGKIYYGSRTGMTVTIRSMTGLDTAQAVIQTEHTRDDAKRSSGVGKFCQPARSRLFRCQVRPCVAERVGGVLSVVAAAHGSPRLPDPD